MNEKRVNHNKTLVRDRAGLKGKTNVLAVRWPVRSIARYQFIRRRKSTLVKLVVGLTALVAGPMAQASTRVKVPEVNQPPFYARTMGEGFVSQFGPSWENLFHDDEWAAIAFYRDPETVPKDFNLLEFFDLRLWTGEVVSPLTIEGFEIWDVFPPTPESAPTPLAVKFNGLGAVPIWFVSWPELQQAVTDRQLTVTDLSSMLPKKGSASFYTENLYPAPGSEVPGLIIDARGYLEDGTGFQYNVGTSYEPSLPCCSSDRPGQFVHIAFASTPSLPGDLDSDGDVDAADFDAEGTAIRTGQTGVKFDLNSDGSVNNADFTYLVENIKKTYIGDANLDGVFGSGDFVKVFKIGEYEDATNDNSGWDDGDFNYDQDFDSGDFVAAFQADGFEKGPRAAVNGVPEPSTFVLTLLGLLSLIRMRRK